MLLWPAAHLRSDRLFARIPDENSIAMTLFPLLQGFSITLDSQNRMTGVTNVRSLTINSSLQSNQYFFFRFKKIFP